MKAFLRVQPTEAIATTRELLRDIDAQIAILELRTLDDPLVHQVADPRFRGALLTTLPHSAGSLPSSASSASSGTRSPQARATSACARRWALIPGISLSTVLLRAGGLALTGVILRDIGAWWAAGVLEGYLFEVRPHDAWTFCTVAALVAATAIRRRSAAGVARRARRSDATVLDD